MERLRTHALLTVTALAALLLSSVPLQAAPQVPGPEGAARFVVGFHGPHGLAPGGTYLGAPVVMANDALRFVVVEPQDAAAFLALALREPAVRYAEEDRVIPWIQSLPPKAGTKPSLGDPDVSPLLTPNDPRFAEQYGPQNIEAPEAWDTATGDLTSAVCVTDTGTRTTHQDLAGPRYLGGFDFVNNDTDPADDNGHGTHVTGSAAASLNNGIGIAGVANVGYYAVKVLNAGGSGSFAQVASGISWCADNTLPKTVISMSLGCSGPIGSSCDVQVMRDAVTHAVQTRGKVLVAAAGNSGPCSPDCVGLPAAYADAIAVGCTTRVRNVCSFSSRGPDVEVSAPGQGVLSTWNTADDAYNSISGTSMSTPHVSGAVALAWGHLPALTNAQLRARLNATAKDLGPAGRDSDFGWGEVGLACLLANTVPCPVPPPPPCGSPPANDCFVNATLVPDPLPYTATQSTGSATLEAGEPLACATFGGTIDASVWFRYTSNATGGALNADTMGSNFDTVLAAYTGPDVANLTQVACNDDADSTLQSRIGFSALPSTTYWFQASGWNGASGSLTLHLTGGGGGPGGCSGGPANNCFADAVVVPSLPSTRSQSTGGANLEGGEPRPCGAIGSTVWYRFTAPFTGTVVADTLGSNYDTVLAAYTGSSLAGLTLRACNDDAVGLLSRIEFPVTAGTTYQVQLGGYNAQTGSAVLHLASGACPGPANNCFADALDIVAPSTHNQSTAGATLEPGEPAPTCAPIGASVWFDLTPAQAGPVALATLGSDYDTVLAVYTGPTLGSLAQVTCNDDAVGLSSAVAFLGQAGTTYHIQVSGHQGASGNLELRALGVPT